MRRRRVGGAFVASMVATAVVMAGPAGADPAISGTASGFGATATLAGNDVIPPTPAAEVVSSFGDSVPGATVAIPADPLAVNGTLIAEAHVHQAADLTSVLEQPASAQEVAGPYNALAFGQVEDLEVLIDAVDDGVPLLEADAIRGEAVAVCAGQTVAYAANSEVVNLVIGGEDPFSGPLNDLVQQIADAIEPFADLVDIDVNVVEVTSAGASVDALVITVLQVVDPEAPLVQIRLGHAEVSGVTCGVAPQCSDDADNDGDAAIDEADPGCHTDGNPNNPASYDPNDNDERNQCSDQADNDGDGTIDAADPGCHSDGDPGNPASYNPNDNDERSQCSDQIDNDGDGAIDFSADPGCTSAADETESPDPSRTEVLPATLERAELARTGSSGPAGTAALLGTTALALVALRRRLGRGEVASDRRAAG